MSLLPGESIFDTAQFVPGQAVTWRHKLPGGYGWTERVEAVVAKVGPKRVTIRFTDRSGNVICRSVTAASLFGHDAPAPAPKTESER